MKTYLMCILIVLGIIWTTSGSDSHEILKLKGIDRMVVCVIAAPICLGMYFGVTADALLKRSKN